MVKSSLGWLGGRYDAVRGVVGVTSLSGQAKRRKKKNASGRLLQTRYLLWEKRSVHIIASKCIIVWTGASSIGSVRSLCYNSAYTMYDDAE